MKTNWLIGLNLSHDSSASLHSSSGEVVIALEEERFTRRKNEASFPQNALMKILSSGFINNLTDKIKVVIGSHRNPNDVDLRYWHQIMNPPKLPGWPNQPYLVPPGDHFKIEHIRQKFFSSSDYLNFQIKDFFNKLDFNILNEISFISHHDAHSASGALGTPWRLDNEYLSFSLDGSGDDESGVIQMFDANGFIRDLARIPQTNSLGLIYSEVTARYGFKRHRHEGKITGLAAFGKYSQAVEYLFNCIEIYNGKPYINISKNKLHWVLNRILVKSRFKTHKIPNDIERMIDVATSLSPEYPDLAFAIQEVIETLILKMVSYWLYETQLNNVTLAGGVFSNVKLNQKIYELPEVRKVFIFPNMGDGGLCVGGVWRYLSDKNSLTNQNLYRNMYLGGVPLSGREDITFSLPRPNEHNGVLVHEIKDQLQLSKIVAEIIYNGCIVASCFGRMEFGPRALGNRSIFARPFSKDINVELNRRLRRTEFMPFAPIVMDEYAKLIFEVSDYKSIDPFKFMTMTCYVKDDWKSRLAAVVHIDGTARPQFINKNENYLIWNILNDFYQFTGTPVLINTSFNTHEEPIIENMEQALDTLMDGKIDLLFDENSIYFSKLNPFKTFFEQSIKKLQKNT